MCEGCWDDAGRPTALPPTAVEFGELHHRLHEMCPAGGPLHVVLDDWNLDGHINPYDAGHYDDETIALANRISELLNAMTVPERYASLAAAEGFFDPVGGEE